MPTTIQPKLFQAYNTQKARGRIFHGDALEYLRGLPSSYADIVFLDPPFNLGKKYSTRNRKLDQRSDEDYVLWIENVLDESVRILKKGGALYLYHLPRFALRFGSHLSQYLSLQHWIAISMKNGFVRGRHLYPAHYSLLYFSKGEVRTFTRPKIRPAVCRHCRELIKDYGGYRSIIEKKGINLSDVWDDLSPLRHQTTKFRKPNELHPKIFERVLKISGRKGLVYLDPFAGSGSGVVAAVKTGMRFDACDIVESNCVLIRDRVNKTTSESKRGG